jgi:hypothetical protein
MEHVQASDLTGFLGGLALRVVEVGRDGDDRIRHGLAEVAFRVTLELLEHPRADLLRVVGLAVDVHLPARVADVALHRTDGAVDVGDGLPLGDLTNQYLAILGERDDAGRGARTLGVRDHLRFAAGENGDDGVGGTEIDTDGS